MKAFLRTAFGVSLFAVLSTLPAAAETKLTIATVNNGDMIRMQGLTEDFTTKNPDITLDWVTLEENVLRQKVTTDIATKGGQFDVLTIGTYEVPIWAKKGWLVPLDNLGADYDVDDLLPAIRGGLSMDGKLYAAPFYGESSMVMYRTDLMEKAGLKMPDAPTWEFIGQAARAMTDKANGIYGVCLRGKAGWGENMAFLTATSNSFGARWFDENWKPQFDQPEWKNTLDFYLEAYGGCRPSGRLLKRLQRKSRAVQCRQMRHVDRCHGRRFLRDQPQGFLGRRQGWVCSRSRQRPWQARQLAVGLVAGGSRRFAEGRCGAEIHLLGDQQGLSRSRRGQGRLGQCAARHAHLALHESRVSEGALRQDDARLDQLPPIRPIRPSSRFPMSACSSWRSPSSRALPQRLARSSPRHLRARRRPTRRLPRRRTRRRAK